MGNDEEGPVEKLERLLQHLLGGDVEVVCGLVQHQQVGRLRVVASVNVWDDRHTHTHNHARARTHTHTHLEHHAAEGDASLLAA